MTSPTGCPVIDESTTRHESFWASSKFNAYTLVGSCTQRSCRVVRVRYFVFYFVRASSCNVQWVYTCHEGGIAVMHLFYHSACVSLNPVQIATSKFTDASANKSERHSILWIYTPMFPRVFFVPIKTISNELDSPMQASTCTPNGVNCSTTCLRTSASSAVGTPGCCRHDAYVLVF